MKRLRLFLAVAAGILLAATPAHAPPVAVAVAVVGVAVAVSAVTTGVILSTFVILTALSVALSFVAQALMRPSSASGGGGGGGLSPSGISHNPSRVTIDQKQTIRQNTAPRRIIYGRTRVGGIYGFLHTTEINQHLWGTVMLAGHQVAAIPYILFDDEVQFIDGLLFVRGGRFSDVVMIERFTGIPGQGASGLLVNNLPGKWDGTMRGEGIAYFAFNLMWDNQTGVGDVGAKIWTGGIPNMTAVVDGKVVHDPRDNLHKYTPNAALIIADYLTDTVYGLGVDWATGINIPALIASANVCDEVVIGADGAGHLRYTINGSFLSDAAPDEILGRMAAAMHGKIIYDGDQWTIIAGYYQTPELVLTDDDMIEPSQVQALTSAREMFNGVKGTCVTATSLLFPAVDFPSIISDTMLAQDSGVRRIKDIELPFTSDTNTAQRIAKIDLLRARQEIGEVFVGRLSCWRVRAGDTVLRTSERFGWTNKPFEAASVRFVARPGDGGKGPTLGVELTLMEIDASAYDWNTSEELPFDPAPNTDFPDVFNVRPPGAITAIEELYVSRQGGGVKSMLKVSWLPSPDSFVTEYLLQYSIAGSGNWISRAPTASLMDEITDLSPGEYDLRVFAKNWAGNYSALSATKRVSVYGVIAPPITPQNLTLTTMGGFCFLRWDRAIDLDVLEGGSVIIRHSPSISNPLWAEGVSLTKPLAGNDTAAAVPARLGTYMVKFRDASGNYSVDPAKVLGFQNSVHQFVGIGDAIEDPAFSGAKTNMVVDTGVLFLTPPPGINIDSVPDIDALTSFDNFATGFPPGEYIFAERINLLVPTRCRLTSFVTSLVYGTGDLIDARSTPIDDWATIDGDVTGDEADATIWVRWTNDDPDAGPATWSEYQRLDSAEFENAAYEFKLIATREDESILIQIAELAVIAEEVAP